MDDRKTLEEVQKEIPDIMRQLVEILQMWKKRGVDVKEPDPEILAEYGLVWEE